MNVFWPSLPIAAALVCLYLLSRLWHSQRGTQNDTRNVAGKDAEHLDPYEAIDPLTSLDWRSTPPIKVWPFRPKYHMSMSLEKLPISNIIEVDNTFLDRMHLRRTVLDEHPAETKQCNKGAEPAVLELYDWLIRTYLPRRFPTVYKPVSAEPLEPHQKREPGLFNTVSQTTIPLHPASSMEALDTLGAQVDTDFLILLPSSTAQDGSPIYHLEAFVTCFPAGFSTREKCGKPLATIHAPVPGYEAKLEKSMDRFFARLEVGKAVKRSNWSISTNDILFSEGGNHLYEKEGENPFQDEKADRDLEKQRAEVDVEKCRLRCERQTLHRLPKTKALVFAFKTYLYHLSEVKEAGAGPELAEAIEGLAMGSVPNIAFYKRQMVWGDKVIEYLRS